MRVKTRYILVGACAVLATAIFASFVFRPQQPMITVEGHAYFATNEKNLARLTTIRSGLQKIIDYSVLNKFPDAVRSTRMQRRWRKTVLGATLGSDEEAAYVLDAGTEMRFCLKTDNEDNTLMFVAIHELAHLMTQRWRSHGDDFINNMNILLNAAVELGVYKRENYSVTPTNVCGTWLR